MCVILYLKKQNQMKQMWLKVICFPGSSAGKDSVCNVGDPGLIPGLERSPGEGQGNPLPSVFLPGESPEQKSLVGYNPWGC